MNEQQREMRRAAGALAVGLGGLGLRQVADPRAEDRVTHPLWKVLLAVLLGLGSGCRSLKDVERLTAHLSPPVRRRTGLFGRLADTTMRGVVARLGIDEARGMLHRQVRCAHRRKQLLPQGLPFGMAALDGKHLRTRLPEGAYAQQQGDKAVARLMTCSLVSGPVTMCIDVRPIPAER